VEQRTRNPAPARRRPIRRTTRPRAPWPGVSRPTPPASRGPWSRG